MITKAVKIQLEHFEAPKWRPSSTLAEVSENCSNSAMGSTWVGEGGAEIDASWLPLSCLQEGCERGGGGGQGGERTNFSLC
jgi:hypothetical protein